MWQLRMKGPSRPKASLTEPSLTSLGLEFQQAPRFLWLADVRMAAAFLGRAVPEPWTSIQISTPFDWPYSASSRSPPEMLAMVVSSGTFCGRPLGRTLTARAPVSCARSTNALPLSTCFFRSAASGDSNSHRSEEHTSELQSLRHLVCRLLLEERGRPSKGEQGVNDLAIGMLRRGRSVFL